MGETRHFDHNAVNCHSEKQTHSACYGFTNVKMNHVAIHVFSQSHLQHWTVQVAGSGKLGVNMCYQPYNPTGCDYRAELQRHMGWAPGRQAVLWLRCGWMPSSRHPGQRQKLRGCGSESRSNSVYKSPHEDFQQSALLSNTYNLSA